MTLILKPPRSRTKEITNKDGCARRPHARGCGVQTAGTMRIDCKAHYTARHVHGDACFAVTPVAMRVIRFSAGSKKRTDQRLLIRSFGDFNRA
jgi:hypothetical protein